MRTTFQYCEYLSIGVKALGRHQLEFPVFCELSMCCLQYQGLTVSVCRAKTTYRRKGFFGLTLSEAQESITIMVGNGGKLIAPVLNSKQEAVRTNSKWHESSNSQSPPPVDVLPATRQTAPPTRGEDQGVIQ